MSNRNNQEDEYVMYILIKNNVKMGKGKVAAQACHSACNTTRILERQRPRDSGYNEWLKYGEPKIVLRSTEADMIALIEQYQVDKVVKRTDTGMWCTHTRDFGRTQIPKNTLTSVAFRPILKSQAPKELGKMKLP